MMTTITLPVFNTSEVNGNQSMVGVMGVDVALQEMLEFEPSYEIGPGGYSFCINQNGYIVFHPNLKTEFEYIDDPPHLDFLDVEIESEAKGELRRAMINLETSKRSFVSLLKMSDGKHIVQHQMEYYFTPVNLTSFSLAVVLPNNCTHYLIAKGIDFDEEFSLKDHEMQGMHLAPWKYCHGTVLELSISEIISNLSYTVKHSPDSCKMHLLERLVWDIRKTGDIIHYWQSEWQDGRRSNVVATFVQSEGGLTRIFPASKSDYLENQMNPSRSLIFQRAYYENDYVFLPNENDYDSFSDASDPVITIAKTITFSRSGIVYKPAVVGLMVEPSWLIPYLKSIPIHLKENEFGCSDPDYIVCYIIDDGGFIISSNQIELYNSTGKFLGYIDPQIMSELYEKNIYKRNEDINYEDRCPKPKKKKNAGFRILASPFYSSLSFLDIGWLFDVSAWSYLKYWFLSLFSFINVPNSQALPEFYVLPNETICTTHEAQYYWGNWASSYAGEISFSNCTRYYSLAKVGEMNIILLVTSKPCQLLSFEYVEPLLQAKEEVAAPNSSLCNRPLRYRKRPDKCFSYSSEQRNMSIM
ncbi:voltage-dependent calcium channel subunit alpha-2/delta-1-like isoform X2 [Stegodyphus dumicola]|uniref:voltage-dependent calcium channel subunit alpha-2/delta-1-like isoform X2 n=1 Tax=Stegodyphus dumicola TaxID=202533 RepID=UPI0015ABDD9A|nr:voltage-dependent calcium channel subunit alpha-2/delta-1-like isoform X2 [Stegodyphus dumicola]